MAQVTIKELLEAGVHFGHQTRRWNPKMRRFIFGERGGIHIIDLQKTERLLEHAQEFAGELAGRGGTILFVGTKKQARDTIEEAAKRAGMPYVNQRWLGGLLTNFQTINKRIKRLHELTDWTEGGTMELLPTRERIAAMKRARQARDQPRRRARHAAPAGRDVRGGPQDRGDRRARGRAAEDPDHRAGGHQLRSGPGELRDPRQRRRDPLVQGDHRRDRRRGGRARAPRFRAEEEAARREREEKERREAEERAARKEAEEKERQEAEERARREAEEAGFSPDEPATPTSTRAAAPEAAPRERRTFEPDEEG